MTKLIPRMYFHNMLVYVYCSKKVKLSSKGTSKAVFFTMNIYLVLDDVLYKLAPLNCTYVRYPYSECILRTPQCCFITKWT